MWLIRPGKDFAIHGLEALDLEPAHMLELAISYSIPQWVKSAVAKLIDTTILTHNGEQILKLGISFVYIVKGREMLMFERLCMAHIAYPVPETPGLGCENHEQCQKAWADVWFKQISRHLFHPLLPLQLNRVVDQVSATTIPRMTASCKEATIVNMIISDKFGIQDRIVHGATTAILKAYNLDI